MKTCVATQEGESFECASPKCAFMRFVGNGGFKTRCRGQCECILTDVSKSLCKKN